MHYKAHQVTVLDEVNGGLTEQALDTIQDTHVLVSVTVLPEGLMVVIIAQSKHNAKDLYQPEIQAMKKLW